MFSIADNPETYEEKEIHLRDYINIVRKRKLLVFTFFIITVTIVLIATLTAVPIYEASTRLLIEKNETSPLMPSYGYVQYDPEFLLTQSQIITSFPVARKVCAELKLADTYDQHMARYRPAIMPWHSGQKMLEDGVGSLIKSTREVFAKPAKLVHRIEAEERNQADMMAEMVRAGIVVEPVPDTKIIKLSYRSPNPELARLIANATAKAYIDQLLDIKMKAMNYNLKWMSEKAEDEARKLKKSDQALINYMKSKDIVTIENRVAIIPQKLSELSIELTKAESRRQELATLYRKLKSVQSRPSEVESIMYIAENATLKALQDDMLEAEQRVMEHSKKYGPKHPLMVKVKDELAILEKKRGQAIQRIIKTVKHEYEMATSNEHDIKGQLEKTKQEAVSLNEKFVQYNILKREIETNQNLYNVLMSRMKEQSMTEQAHKINVWIVDEAKTPQFPSKPNKRRNIMLGLVLGLFGGIGLAFFIEYLDNTIKTPEDIEERFRVPVLATVAKVKHKKKDIGDVISDHPAGELAESFNSLRNSILLSSADAPPQAMLISSMAPQDGKTTIASNLALSFAATGKRVLLVDSDLRRPMLHKIFHLPNTTGLSTFIASGKGTDLIHEIADKNLHVLTSGPIPPNSSELLISQRLNKFITSLRKRYDFILFDTPPIMSVSDALILAKIVDANLIVARFGKTTHEMILHGFKSMKEIDARLLGVVINAVDQKKSGYHYYYNYSRKYRQYYTQENRT